MAKRPKKRKYKSKLSELGAFRFVDGSTIRTQCENSFGRTEMKKPKKRKTKRASLSAILKRKDVKAYLRQENDRGYIRGFNACKNNS